MVSVIYTHTHTYMYICSCCCCYHCCWISPPLKMTSVSLYALRNWTMGLILPVSHSLPSCLPIRKANLCNWTSKRAEDFLFYGEDIAHSNPRPEQTGMCPEGCVQVAGSQEILTWEEQLVQQVRLDKWERALQWSSMWESHEWEKQTCPAQCSLWSLKCGVQSWAVRPFPQRLVSRTSSALNASWWCPRKGRNTL